MPSTYPSGFANGVNIRGVPIEVPHPGKVFWVNNSSVLPEKGIAGSDSNPGTYLKPFSSLDYAIGRCVADRGDVIYLMPGYTQSMTAADAVDVDVAGVSIIGLGQGSKRAKFTYDNSAGEFVIGAANVTIDNLWFVPSVTGITKAIDVEIAGDYFTIRNCRFADAEAAGTDEFLTAILVPITCPGGRILRNYFDAGEAGAAAAISVATPEGIEISDNYIVGDYSTACITNITAAGTNMVVMRNVLVNGVKSGLNAVAAIVNVAGNELILGDNLIACDVATFALMITNYTGGLNLGNRYTDDLGGATTAVDRSASVVVAADA
jgi:hypothetical protein